MKKVTAKKLLLILEKNDQKKSNKRSIDHLVSTLDPLITPKIQVSSGKGIVLQTNLRAHGGEVLDFCGQTVTCILGQNDPWVAANVAKHVLSDNPSFLSTSMGQEIFYTLPQRVLEISKMGPDSFVNHRLNNGSDANDFAVNLTFLYHKKNQERNTLLAFKGSYHGQGYLPYAVSDLEKHLSFFGHLKVNFLNAPSHASSNNEDNLSINDQKIIEKIKKIGKKSFAVIIEPIQFNNNGNVCSKSFLKALRDVCTEQDVPLIFDEVQTGWGWLGQMTAAEKYGVWPDIMSISKSITAGYGPLSVVVAKNKFRNTGAFGARTNGADVRSLVAAHAVADRLLGIKNVPKEIVGTKLGLELKNGLLNDFDQKSEFLLNKILELKNNINKNAKNIRIGQIKGSGLARLIEIKDKNNNFDSKLTLALQHELLIKGGVFVRTPSNHDEIHTLVLKMPIVAEKTEIETGFERIKNTIINFSK